MDTKRVDESIKPLLWLLGLYIAIRLPILFSCTGTMDLELYRGTIAKEWLLGFNLPWFDYPTDGYSLGALLNGFLTIPAFLVFGETLFALKLVPFLWHLASLVAWFFVWRSFFSQRLVFLILLLFVLAPPRVVEYALSNHGTHFESILWTACSLLILKKIVERNFSWGWGGCLLGLLGGFSSTLHLINGATVFVILLGTFLRRAKKAFYLTYGIGFLVGFAPLLVFNFKHSWVLLDFLKETFIYRLTLHDLSSHVQHAFIVRESGLSGLFDFRMFVHPFDFILRTSYVGVYLFCLFFLFVRKWKFWRGQNHSLDIESFGLVYQIVLLGLIIISRYGWSESYYLPLVPFIGMTIVSSLQRARPILKWSVIGFCLFSGLAGNIGLVDLKELGKPFSLKGYSYEDFTVVMERHYGADFARYQQKVNQALQNRSPEIKKAFYDAIQLEK